MVANGNEMCACRDLCSSKFVTEQRCLRFWIATVCSLSNCPFLSWTTTMLWGLKNGFKPWMQCPMIMSATNNMVFFGEQNEVGSWRAKQNLFLAIKVSSHAGEHKYLICFYWLSKNCKPSHPEEQIGSPGRSKVRGRFFTPTSERGGIRCVKWNGKMLHKRRITDVRQNESDGSFMSFTGKWASDS